MKPKLPLSFGHTKANATVAILALLAGLIFMGAVTGIIVTSGSKNKAEKVVSTSSTSSTGLSPSNSRGIEGFEEIALSVKPIDGATRKYCAALATSETQQSRGMMGQDDFGGYDAMVFQFSSDIDVSFYMANVKIPLSVAFVDSAGNFISSNDMAVCSEEASKCPRYKSERAFRSAIETKGGSLSELGIGSGSTISVGGSCGG